MILWLIEIFLVYSLFPLFCWVSPKDWRSAFHILGSKSKSFHIEVLGAWESPYERDTQMLFFSWPHDPPWTPIRKRNLRQLYELQFHSHLPVRWSKGRHQNLLRWVDQLWIFFLSSNHNVLLFLWAISRTILSRSFLRGISPNLSGLFLDRVQNLQRCGFWAKLKFQSLCLQTFQILL